MVLTVTKLVIASSFVLTIYVHAIKVSRIKVSALRVVHPRDLVSCLGRLGTCLYPLIKVCSNRGHLPVKLGALLGRAIEYVLVDAEDRLVDARIDLVQLDDVYERLDIRPFALRWITRLLVCECPELASGAWKLQLN